MENMEMTTNENDLAYCVRVYGITNGDDGYHPIEWQADQDAMPELVEVKLNETFQQWDERHRLGWIRFQDGWNEDEFKEWANTLRNKTYSVAVERVGYLGIKNVPRFARINKTVKIAEFKPEIWSNSTDPIGKLFLMKRENTSTSIERPMKRPRGNFHPNSPSNDNFLSKMIERLYDFLHRTKDLKCKEMIPYKCDSEEFWANREALQILAGCWNVESVIKDKGVSYVSVNPSIVNPLIIDLESLSNPSISNDGTIDPWALKLREDNANKIYILSHNRQTSTPPHFSQTPLIFAAYCWDWGAFKFFLKKGYDMFEKNNFGESALDIAKRKGFDDLCDLVYMQSKN
jgi:hypothetical protein